MAIILIIALAAAAVGYILYLRWAGENNSDLDPDIRAAAKRLGFTPNLAAAPIASLPSAELCIAAMATAFAAMDENSKADATVRAGTFERRLAMSADQARDATLIAPWLVAQAGGPTPAFEGLTTRLKQLDHGPYFDKLMRVLGDVTAAGTKGMPCAAQADAMGALARIFRTA